MCLGIPGQVVEIREGDPLDRLASVSFGGILKAIRLSYTPEAKVGDYVVVHAGFALSIVQEEEAARVFQALQDLETLEEEFP